MSRYHTDTEVSRFNRSTSTDWFSVSPDVVTVVQAAIAINAQSGGTFDITVAPLVDLWGFGPACRPGRIPTSAEIAAVRENVGSQLLEVRASPPALRKRRPEVQLDLNGIAPGFAVDRIAECLERRGVTNYLIRLDGHIRTHGHVIDGRPWRVGIDRPTELPSGVQLAIELGDAALSTSGDYRHFFEHDGRRYSHIIDPRTGAPADHAATCVSIVADNCLTADAWAKALMVLGPTDGVRLADERGIAAYYVVRAANTEELSKPRGVATASFALRFLTGERFSAEPMKSVGFRSISAIWAVLAVGLFIAAAVILRRRRLQTG